MTTLMLRLALVCFGLAVFALCLEKPKPAVEQPKILERVAEQTSEQLPTVITVNMIRPMVATAAPDFDHSFNGPFRPQPKPVAAEERPTLASLPPKPDPAPGPSESHPRKQKARSDYASRFERYCQRPGKDRYSWIRLSGKKRFCA